MMAGEGWGSFRKLVVSSLEHDVYLLNFVVARGGGVCVGK
jgi:hypothetical protein